MTWPGYGISDYIYIYIYIYIYSVTDEDIILDFTMEKAKSLVENLILKAACGFLKPSAAFYRYVERPTKIAHHFKTWYPIM